MLIPEVSVSIGLWLLGGLTKLNCCFAKVIRLSDTFSKHKVMLLSIVVSN